MIFYSRKSWILSVIIWGLLGFTKYHIGLFQIDPLLFVILFVGLIWFGLNYVIKDGLLLIKIGPIVTYKVRINNIFSVSRSFNPLSSPAVSLKRIQVNYTNGSILISPKKEKTFIKKLREINPTIYNGISWDKENESILTRFVYSIL